MFTPQFLQIALCAIICSVVPQRFIKWDEVLSLATFNFLLESSLFDDKRFMVWVKF